MPKTVASADPELIPDEWIASLNNDADARRINSGTARFRACAPILDVFHPSVKNATALLAVLARWCDAADSGPGPVKRLLETYDESARSRLSVSEYVRLRMAVGVVTAGNESTSSRRDTASIIVRCPSRRARSLPLATRS